MSAGLNMFGAGAELAMSAARANPALELDTGFGGQFSAIYDATRKGHASDSEQNNRYDYVQGILDKLYTATGERFTNPEGLPGPNRGNFKDGGAKGQAYAKVQNRLSQLAKERADIGLGGLSPQEVEAGTVAIGERAMIDETRAGRRAISRSSKIGAFVGGMAGAFRDPLNIAATVVTLPVGGEGSILLNAGKQALIAGSSEFLVQAENYDYRKKIDPHYSLATATSEVAMVAGGGAVLGGGAKALAKLWAGREALGGYVPSQVKDSANVVKRYASLAASPFKSKTTETELLHNQAITRAADDIMTGRPVELPPETFLAANARPGRVYDSDGRSVGVTYEVVEARDLATSHNDQFQPNENFPPELQPRDRERPITQEQVVNMAANLQPERLGPSPQADSGAPIVGPDGLVESGNGRVLAIRRAYGEGNQASNNYRNFLKSQGYDVADMDAPVLVARRVTDLTPDERVKFVGAANRATAMRLSATEQAFADARVIDSNMLQKLESGDIKSAGNRNFVRAFLSKLPRSEQGALVDAHGNLSMEGSRRMSAALMGRAYDDPVLLARAFEDTDSNIRTLSGAFIDSADHWSRMRDAVARGEIPQSMDITKDLLEALRLVIKSRDEKTSFTDLLNQPEMFEGPSEIAKAIGRFFFRDGNLKNPASRADVANMLRTYAQEAEKNLAGERLFGDALSESDVLRASLDKAGRGELAPALESALTPDAIDKIVADPFIDDVVLMEGNRILAAEATGEIPATMVPVMSLDKAGNPVETMRPLSEVMDELDKQIDAADRIEACASGTPVEGAQAGLGL